MSDMQRPRPMHQDTSKTLHERNPTNSNIKNNDQNVEKAAPSRGSGYNIHDILLLLGIFYMQILPWIFFGVVWAKKGLPMNNHVVEVVNTNPHATTYLITLICAIFSMIVTTFFSLAVIRFAQEWVSRPKPTELFHIQVLLAFRHQKWPWKTWKGFKNSMTITRFWLVALVVICLLAFPTLVSNTTSLITPITFNRTGILHGSELDFSSTNADCSAWFEAHPQPSPDCGWKIYNGLSYTECLGQSQMVDALEAGHGNILQLLPRNTRSLTFSQLGGTDGMHFVGPIRGILPMGPGGVPAFNTVQAFPKTAELMSYNYTLNYQGLESKINCSYETESPITIEKFMGNPLAFKYYANCTNLGQSEVLTDQPQSNSSFVSVSGNNTLTYWACQSAPGSLTPSYSIYLHGLNIYGDDYVGNINCILSPIQSAIFPVTYRSTAGILQANDPIAYSPITFSNLMKQTLIGLGNVISDGQNFQDNLVAESVVTYGANFFNQTADQRSPRYLQLYERMIQGILEYEATYLRLIYSTFEPPASCNRIVSGSLTYAVFGWSVTRENISFLLSMTIINLAAFIALILAMVIGKASAHGLKALDPRNVTYAQNVDHEEVVPDEWQYKVAYQPTTVFRQYLSVAAKSVGQAAELQEENAEAGGAADETAESEGEGKGEGEAGGIADRGSQSNNS